MSACSARSRLADADANLPERGEGDGQPVRRASAFVQRDAALGQRERLLVLVTHHRDVGLVAADERQHVFGLDLLGEVLALAERRHRFIGPAGLRERDARQGVDERKVAPVTGCVERRGGLAEVFAHDGKVADAPVGERQFVVRQADGAGVVRRLGEFQGSGEQSDGTRLVAPRRGDAAVHPPERRQPRRLDRFAQRVGRPAESGAGLVDIVLEQPSVGQRAADRQFVVATERGEP